MTATQRLSMLLTLTLLAGLAWAQREGDPTAPDAGEVSTGPGTPAETTGSWPQFRGADRENIARPDAPLAGSWPAEGPRELWRIEGLGTGYSGPAIHAGRVYLNDYDEANARWMVRCLSLADGQEIWRWSYPRLVRPNHGITRSTPAVDDDVVISLDPKCALHAFDARTGERLWARNLPPEFGLRIPPWYNGQCPLLDGDRVIIGIGGRDALLAAFDKRTGEPVWTTPNTIRQVTSHASVMPAELGGTKQYLWATLQGIVGVDAETGTLLWDSPFVGRVALAPSPLGLDDEHVFMTSGYKVGSLIVRVSRNGDSWQAEPVRQMDAEHFESECHTPILHDGRLLAVDMPGQLVSLTTDGDVQWRSASPDGKTFGLGSYLLVGNKLLVLEGDTGRLHLVDPRPDGPVFLAAAQPVSGHDVWAPMAYADGRLILRDLNTLVCLELPTE